jgi:hypothetical protein
VQRDDDEALAARDEISKLALSRHLVARSVGDELLEVKGFREDASKIVPHAREHSLAFGIGELGQGSGELRQRPPPARVEAPEPTPTPSRPGGA